MYTKSLLLAERLELLFISSILMMPNELQLTNLRMIQMSLDRIQMKMPQPTSSLVDIS